MTIPAGQSGVTYHTGNGTASTFDYEFKITAEADLKVTQTDTNKIDTLLVLGTDYTVSGVGNNAGGAITLVAGPLASGYTLTIEDNVEISQLTPFGNQSAFYANLHEDSYDKNTRIARKAIYELDRTIKISGSVQGVDTELPKPESLKLFRWNETATALENVETSDLITVAQFSNFRTDTFNDGVDFTSGSTTEINLSSSPGVKANTQIYFDGVYQEKSEYSLNGNLITFNSAIPSGISVIEVTHGKAADVLALDLVSEILSSPYTTTVSDNGKYFEVIGNQTITLVDALSAGAGYRIAVKSDSSSTVTVARSGSDTIDDATSVQIGPDSFAFFIVNSLRNGYISDISKTFQIINVDNINENTPSSGVTIDGVLLKDGGGNLTGNLDVGQTLTVDTVNETTLDTGVTVDGVLLKDGGAVFADGATIEVDAINEATAAAGVTADGVLLKDGGVTATSASSIAASSGTALRVTNTGSGDSFLVEDSANPDSDPFVITSLGNIVKGHTTNVGGYHHPQGEVDATPATQIHGDASTKAQIALTSWSASDPSYYAPAITLAKSSSATVGTKASGLVSGEDLGSLVWSGDDGTSFIKAAMIQAEVDGTPGVSDMPGRLTFSTTADGAATPTERIRIDSAGNVGIGVTPTAKLHVTNTGSVNSLLVEDSTNPDSSPFVIDNDGRIIQGHTASLAGASSASFEQHSTSDNSTVGAPNASLASWSSDGGFAGGLTFDRSLSGTVGTETTVVNGTDLGSIYWRGTDGSGFLQAAEILGEMDATPAGSGVDMPGRLSFRTTAVGSASPIERMRINRDGNILVNTATAATGSPKLDLVGDDRQCIVMSDNTTDATQKNASIGGRHHTNAEEPVSVIKSISDGGNNSVLVGGGESFFNAATLVRLYAAANTTTLTGTEQVRISSDSANFIGDVLIGDSVSATPTTKYF
jgi:hypothetical protein